jgi:hypothetical protein
LPSICGSGRKTRSTMRSFLNLMPNINWTIDNFWRFVRFFGPVPYGNVLACLPLLDSCCVYHNICDMFLVQCVRFLAIPDQNYIFSDYIHLGGWRGAFEPNQEILLPVQEVLPSNSGERK